MTDEQYANSAEPEKLGSYPPLAESLPMFPNYGWLCPRCGSANSPAAMTCYACTPARPLEITC